MTKSRLRIGLGKGQLSSIVSGEDHSRPLNVCSIISLTLRITALNFKVTALNFREQQVGEIT